MKKMNKILGVLTSALISLFIGAATGTLWVALALFLVSFLIPTGVAGMGLITPSQVTWNGKEIMSIAEAVMEDVYQNPELTQLHTTLDNVVAKEQIVYLGLLSKISKKDAGCGTGKITNKNIPMSEKTWDPEKIKVWLADCGDTLDESFFVWSREKGIKRDDLTMTDYGRFIIERMSSAALEDLYRIIWFNDPSHTNVSDSPAGVVTDGVDLADYTIIEGLWAQIYDIIAVTPSQRVTIDENAEATKAEQLDLGSSTAINTFRNLLQNADKRLKGSKELVFYATDTLVDNYMTYLESQGVDSSFQRIQNATQGGFDSGLRYRNITIYRIDFWDRMIQDDFDNGTTYDKPHRAILTTKANLPVGFDSEAAAKSIKQWYDESDEETNWKMKYLLDTKVIKDYMIQVAY